ncbi:MAG TPA: hypothetical protein VLJ59_10160 [Mycobacteriales bacterium]|nr:hypothetical protein [Mycobacteriales bacterium]
MIQFLLVIIGIVGLVVGIRQATSGTQAPLRRGNYRGAIQVWATGLLIAFGGFVLAVAALTTSVGGVLFGVVAGGAATAIGGRKLFTDMQKQVSGG